MEKIIGKKQQFYYKQGWWNAHKSWKNMNKIIALDHVASGIFIVLVPQ